MHADDPGSVPLRAVLRRRDLALRAVVLPPDARPRVRWAVVSELLDPGPYLNGGELVLTAGVDMPTGSDDLRDYVARLVASDVRVLGFGLTPVFDEVPEALVRWCAAYGLPLVAAEASTPFVAIGKAVGELLEEQHVEELHRVGTVHQRLARSVAAAAPTEQVLTTLAGALDCWAVLVADGYREVTVGRGGTAGRAARPREPPPLSTDVAELVAKLRAPGGPRSAKARMGTDEVFLHTVGVSGIVVVGRAEPLTATDRAVLGTAVALLGLLPRGGRPTPQSGPLLARLLLDSAPPGGLAPLLSRLTGRDPSEGSGREFRVLHAVRSGGRTPLDPHELAALLASEVVDPGDRPPEDAATVRVVVTDLGDHTTTLEELHARGWLGALSGPTEPEGLPAADAQAADLLPRARATGRPLAADEGTDPLEAAIAPDAARRAAREILGPLANDTASARALRTTLHTWLAHHGNWDRASADLGAHRNSVRYRIGRVERDLAVNLSDPEQRMRLWFALTRAGEDRV